MTKREPGTYALDELVSDIDGSTAFQVRPDLVNNLVADSWESATGDLDTGIVWTCEPDDDDLDIAITPDALAALVRRARAHCAGCPGGCDR